MMSRALTLMIHICVFMTFSTAVAASFPPLIIVYDSSMPGLADGVAEILGEADADAQVVVLHDPTVVASLLAYPNVKCLVLTSVASGDLSLLVRPVLEYFRAGGAVIGFHGACWQTKLDGVATEVFPAYGNATLPGIRKEGRNYVQYVKSSQPPGAFADLPEAFDLIGQFYVFQSDSKRRPIIPRPPRGTLSIIYEEAKTGAPLALAYESPGGARSFCLPGLFLRDNPSVGSYYGLLLEQPEFKALLVHAYTWVTEGNPRFDRYSASFQRLLEAKQDEIQELRARAQMREGARRRGRAVMLLVLWVGGIAVVAGLIRWAFRSAR